MRAAKQEEKSQGTQHPIGHHQGYVKDTEHMGGAATFPQTISYSYAPTTPATMSSDTPMPETSQYQYYQQQVDTKADIFMLCYWLYNFLILNVMVLKYVL